MTVHAPFNFVTLSGWVYEPDWADSISHDIPFSDGMSGEFDITITAHSKLLVGGKRRVQDGIQTVEPFQLPDGTYAIPERSLRGMIRNVIEIAAFGRMKFVDDKRFSIRDLDDAAKPFYRDRIVGKVSAGWLWFDGQTRGWKITPCEFARVLFEDLEAINTRHKIKSSIEWTRRDTTNKKHKYELWGAGNTGQKLQIIDGFARLASGEAAATDGVLVFTGNPGVRKKSKKAEFFFYGAADDSFADDIDQEVFKSFQDIHHPDDGRPVNSTWAYWENRWKQDRNTRIPVFFIAETGKIASFGLAMMFKLAHQNSVKEVIEHTSRDHLDESKIDLATAIFGVAADEGELGADCKKRLGGLKSRVHLGLAKCSGYTNKSGKWCNAQPPTVAEPVTILSGPKPSYFPAYVRQPAEGNSDLLRRGGNATYATYTPVPTSNEPELRWPEIRGWKRYPASCSDTVADANANDNKKVKVYLKPLEGAVFVSRVRFHNLCPVELGALLWALEWGGHTKLRHRLGMGKPYGYGRISIAVDDRAWHIRPNNADGETLSKQAYMDAFTTGMERAYSKAAKTQRYDGCSWKGSEQLQQLCAMADPAEAKTHNLNYMTLAAGPNITPRNDFQDAKKAHRFLPSYLSAAGNSPPDHKIWGRDVPPVLQAAIASGGRPGAGEGNLRAGEIVTWIEEQIDVEIVSINGAFATVAPVKGGDRSPIEGVALRLLTRGARPRRPGR